MRKLRKLSFIVFIPIAFGLLFKILGLKIENETLELVGDKLLVPGIFITISVIVVIGLILMSTGKLADYKKTDAKTENSHTKEEENENIKDINSSYGYESKAKQGNYMLRHLGENYRNSTRKEKVLGGMFLGFILLDFFLIMVFAYLNIPIGSYICFGIFALTILLAIIVKLVLQKLSMKVSQEKIDNSPKLNGIVDACVLSSTTSTGGAHLYRTTRISNVVYKIAIIAEDNRYIAYSTEFFEKGERVNIAAIGGKRAHILNKIKNTRDDENYEEYEEYKENEEE